MGLFTSSTLNSMDDLLVDQLEDLYDAEQRIVDALPKMVEAASCNELKAAFQEHLAQTKLHVSRLEQAFSLLNRDPNRKTCEAAKGLIKEGEQVIDCDGEDAVKDAALIAAGQRVEHYEIAGYGSARSFARCCGHEEVAQLLQQTLDEEGHADSKLTSIAENSINARAAQS